MVFRTFTKRQTFSFVFAEHIDSISSIFFFPHLTQIRGVVQHKKAIPNHIDKKGQKYDTIAKI